MCSFMNRSSFGYDLEMDGLQAEALGVELLIQMLASQQLGPYRLVIRDNHTEFADYVPLDLEIAAILARNILDGADLAVTTFALRNPSEYETMITAELSPEHQGRGISYSLVRRADLCFTKIMNPYSYWADRIILHGQR